MEGVGLLFRQGSIRLRQGEALHDVASHHGRHSERPDGRMTGGAFKGWCKLRINLLKDRSTSKIRVRLKIMTEIIDADKN